MSFKKPLLFAVCAPLLALTGCVYDEAYDHDHHDHSFGWDRHDHRYHDASPASYRDRDRDGVPDRWEAGHRGW
ncbi:MAG TPA: hypothetical protein VK986_20630 [Tepidisphaeraceae bacterium]|nr:hypothetical protein [Tepidisphaeraceae bacterium]